MENSEFHGQDSDPQTSETSCKSIPRKLPSLSNKIIPLSIGWKCQGNHSVDQKIVALCGQAQSGREKIMSPFRPENDFCLLRFSWFWISIACKMSTVLVSWSVLIACNVKTQSPRALMRMSESNEHRGLQSVICCEWKWESENVLRMWAWIWSVHWTAEMHGVDASMPNKIARMSPQVIVWVRCKMMWCQRPGHRGRVQKTEHFVINPCIGQWLVSRKCDDWSQSWSCGSTVGPAILGVDGTPVRSSPLDYWTPGDWSKITIGSLDC